jgi:hypothetical protein
MTDTSFAIVLPSGRENRKMHLLEKQEILNYRENDENIFLNKKKNNAGNAGGKTASRVETAGRKKGKNWTKFTENLVPNHREI